MKYEFVPLEVARLEWPWYEAEFLAAPSGSRFLVRFGGGSDPNEVCAFDGKQVWFYQFPKDLKFPVGYSSPDNLMAEPTFRYPTRFLDQVGDLEGEGWRPVDDQESVHWKLVGSKEAGANYVKKLLR